MCKFRCALAAEPAVAIPAAVGEGAAEETAEGGGLAGGGGANNNLALESLLPVKD